MPPKPIVNVGDLSKLVRLVDLRPIISQMGLAVKTQGTKEHPRGTCSVFATTFLLEYLVCKERRLTASNWQDPEGPKNSFDFSEEYLNAVANIAQQAYVDGGFFSDMWQGYKEYGIVDEAWFPYQQTFDPDHIPDKELIAIGKQARFYQAGLMYSEKKPPQNAPPDESPMGFSDQQISAILKHLDDQVPVAFGYHGAENTTYVPWGGLKIYDDLPDAYNGPFGHSMDIVGYSAADHLPSGGYFIVRTSWGPGWADNGYAYITFNYIRKFAYDAVVYERPPRAKFEVPQDLTVEPKSRKRFPEPSMNLIDQLGKVINPKSRLPKYRQQ